MTNQQKTAITSKANEYITAKGITASQFAKIAKVNESYLSNILNGNYTVNTSGSAVEIQDKYFNSIAEVIGYAMEKQYWLHVRTREFMDAITILEDSRARQAMCTIIIDTGAGKTYTSERYKLANPLHTYVITMHSLLKINDLFNELAYQLGIPEKGGKAYKRTQLIIKLRELRRNGARPIIIIDEGENMNGPMLQMLKGFYDALVGYAGITLIGTSKLKEMLLDAKIKDKQAGPQLWRRIKAGMRTIKVQQEKATRFAPFFEALRIERPLQRLLCETCDNYGELHDYLEPALREADRLGVTCDEEFFRVMYDMPKPEPKHNTTRKAA